MCPLLGEEGPTDFLKFNKVYWEAGIPGTKVNKGFDPGFKV